MAWKKLEKRWDPKSREDKIDSLMKFLKLRMENIWMKLKIGWHTWRKNKMN